VTRPPTQPVRVASAIAWVGIAVVLSLGSAGIVSGMSRSPADGSRPELTWAADEAVRPGLAAASTDLTALSAEVDQLGQYGRNAIAALVNRDTVRLNATIASGISLVGTISADTAAIRVKLASLPGIATADETAIGADLRERYDAITVALSTTADLQTSWIELTSGSAVATALTKDLADHDMYAGQAVKLGSTAQYAKARASLVQAEASLASAASRRDALAANTVDVSILTQWIDRNGAFDTAASTLYKLLEASPRKVTPAIRTAFADLSLARQNLPPDTRALVVILNDLARGGLNQAVIAIEEAKANLANAVALIAGAGSPPGP
jgi:alkylhydroperoxidase/carboxymuconolactone decarboxylase family protein YurZ